MPTDDRDTAQPTVLPDDACPHCGTMMEERSDDLTYAVNGQRIPVKGVSHLRCPACGEAVLRNDEVALLRQRAFTLYRNKYDLLSADEIRAIRERFGLTQRGFAELLRLGSNTLSRWEAGRKVQTAALDLLLRLIRDLPDSLTYLRKNAA